MVEGRSQQHIRLEDAYNRATAALAAGDPARAAAVAQHLLRYYPQYLDAYRLLGEAHLERGRADEALRFFQHVLHADPQNVLAHVGKAIVAEERGQIDTAIVGYERAFEIDPSITELRTELLRLYKLRYGSAGATIRTTPSGLAYGHLRAGLRDAAISELSYVAQTRPDRWDIEVALVEALWRNEQLDEAAAVAGDILAGHPACAKCNWILGYIHWTNGRTDSGRKYLQEAVAHDPTYRIATSIWTATPWPLDRALTQPQPAYVPPWSTGLLSGNDLDLTLSLPSTIEEQALPGPARMVNAGQFASGRADAGFGNAPALTADKPAPPAARAAPTADEPTQVAASEIAPESLEQISALSDSDSAELLQENEIPFIPAEPEFAELFVEADTSPDYVQASSDMSPTDLLTEETQPTEASVQDPQLDLDWFDDWALAAETPSDLSAMEATAEATGEIEPTPASEPVEAQYWSPIIADEVATTSQVAIQTTEAMALPAEGLLPDDEAADLEPITETEVAAAPVEVMLPSDEAADLEPITEPEAPAPELEVLTSDDEAADREPITETEAPAAPDEVMLPDDEAADLEPITEPAAPASELDALTPDPWPLAPNDGPVLLTEDDMLDWLTSTTPLDDRETAQEENDLLAVPTAEDEILDWLIKTSHDQPKVGYNQE